MISSSHHNRILPKEELQALASEIERRVAILYGTDPDAFIPQSCRKEAIVLLLWEYTVGNGYYKDYNPDDYSLEIVETCEDVFLYYSPDKGSFISYYNKSVSGRLRAAHGKTVYETTHQQSGFSKRKIAAISDTIKAMSSMGIEVTAEMVITSAILEDAYITADDVYSVMNTDRSMDMQIRNSDGASSPLGSLIADSTPGPEDLSVSSDFFTELICAIDMEFSSLRGNQKPYLKEALTLQFSDAISAGLKSHPELMPELEKATWFDSHMFYLCETAGEPPQQQSIAKKYGINPVSLSRAVKTFKQKLAQRL